MIKSPTPKNNNSTQARKKYLLIIAGIIIALLVITFIVINRNNLLVMTSGEPCTAATHESGGEGWKCNINETHSNKYGKYWKVTISRDIECTPSPIELPEGPCTEERVYMSDGSGAYLVNDGLSPTNIVNGLRDNYGCSLYKAIDTYERSRENDKTITKILDSKHVSGRTKDRFVEGIHINTTVIDDYGRTCNIKGEAYAEIANKLNKSSPVVFIPHLDVSVTGETVCDINSMSAGTYQACIGQKAIDTKNAANCKEIYKIDASHTYANPGYEYGTCVYVVATINKDSDICLNNNIVPDGNSCKRLVEKQLEAQNIARQIDGN